jgi:PAS domain S-box-containing protein
LRYARAAAVAVLAVVARRWLTPLLGTENPYHTVWLAVAFSAWYCGLGPSVVATIVSLLGVWYWLLAPVSLIGRMDRTQFWGMVGFVVLSGFISALGEANRRAKLEAERSEDALHASREQLTIALQDRTAEVEQKTAQVVEQARWIDLANDAIFVRTVNHRFSYWNKGAERLYGWTAAEVLGHPTQDFLKTRFPVPLEEITKNELWEGELVQTRRDGSLITVASRWSVLRDKQEETVGWLQINTDISARKQAEAAARRLSGRILNLQDEERRRIARELHDSLGQYLTAVKINLDLMAMNARNSDDQATLTDCIETVKSCIAETRTLSHLLHPPLLDEAGLSSAVRWYTEGLAERSGMEIALEFPEDLQRLDRDVETALFRAIQEALTNVHKHSGASKVSVHLEVDAETVALEIRDNGKGIPEHRLKMLARDEMGSGVGLAGMRERVREVGGKLNLHSASTGTVVRLEIPLAEARDTVNANGNATAGELSTA